MVICEGFDFKWMFTVAALHLSSERDQMAAASSNQHLLSLLRLTSSGCLRKAMGIIMIEDPGPWEADTHISTARNDDAVFVWTSGQVA